MIAVVWNTGNRRAAWDYLVDELTPDLALLQEFTPRPGDSKRGEIVHAPAYAERMWGSAVYAKKGVVREVDLPADHRGWLMAAEVEVPGFDSLIAVSVHARILDDYVRPNIDRAFEALEALLAGRSFVLGGDLNLSRNYDKVYRTTHHSEFLDALPGRGFVDCLQKFHPGEQQTFCRRQSPNVYQDDYVFVSKNLEPQIAGCDVAASCDVVVNRMLSDHCPLRLILSEPAAAAS
jgi:endonuclease/exonuclease/phosphatase family metal-dependent hydrolase